MAERMVFHLVGRDDLSRVLNQAGGSADGMRQQIVRAAGDSSASITRLTRDSRGRLHDMRGHFVSAAQAARLLGDAAGDTSQALAFRGADGRLRDMRGRFLSASQAARGLADSADDGGQALRRLGNDADAMRTRVVRAAGDSSQAIGGFTRSTNGPLRDARGRFIGVGGAADNMGESASDAADALGKGGGGLSAALSGVGAAAAISTLPALSAMVPLLAGAVLGTKTLKLAFSGVGDAVALAGEDTKEYKKALKAMGPEQRAFTKELVSAKKGFEGFGKEIQKIVLPSFTKALKDAGPAISAVKDGMRGMAGTFAEFGTQFGKLFASNRFRDSLQKNFDLGAGFFKQLAQPLTVFTQSLLDFGAASKPVLDAFGEGISGLLSQGLPGFFDGLKGGIDGTAAMFSGLFDALNKVLPAFGELAGAIASSVGPALGDLFTTVGDTGAGAFRTLAGAVRAAKPLFGEIAGAIRIFHLTLQTVGIIARDVGKVLLESFWPSFREAENAKGPIQNLAIWLGENRDRIREIGQQVSNFIIDLVTGAVTQLPTVIAGFRLMATGILLALDGIVSGAAYAFGWIPGLGDDLQEANRQFDGFKDTFLDGLGQAEAKSREFADRVAPRLRNNKLKMNINNWRDQISRAREQLSDKNLPPEKRGKLLQNIRDWEAKIRSAKRQGDAVAGRKYEARLKGNKRHFDAVASAVRGTTFAAKSMQIRGNDGPLRSTIGRWNGRTVGTVVMNIATRQKRADGGPIGGFAGGGPIPGRGGIPGYPAGGPIQGVGTGTSDSNLILASRGEYMIKAAAVRRYGVAMFDELNAMRVKTGANRPAFPQRTPSGGAGGGTHVTYNVYPRASVIDVHDLRLIQRQEEARQRVGRPR